MKVTAKAHPNIALIKYFGKKDEKEVLPYNDSISITWDTFETRTTLETAKAFNVFLNGHVASIEDREKIKTFLTYFTNDVSHTVVSSKNNFPTAAGLASSASAFAALSVAANRYFNCNFSEKNLEAITRKGSGSAIRSLYGGVNRFNRNGYVTRIDASLEEYRLLVVLISDHAKAVSSRKAMKHVVETSPLHKAFIDTANEDSDALEKALLSKDFHTVGRLSEKSALSLHGSMLAANPPIHYLSDAAFRVMDEIVKLRRENREVYFTMDAGPNIKVLTTKKDVRLVANHLKAQGFNVLPALKPSKEGAHIL